MQRTRIGRATLEGGVPFVVLPFTLRLNRWIGFLRSGYGAALKDTILNWQLSFAAGSYSQITSHLQTT